MASKKKVPGKISAKSLERSALFHLERRALSVMQLRRALQQKVRRAERHHGACADAPAWIDDVIARCVRSGLLDDKRVAEGRVLALRARGASKRGIAYKLKQKGVDSVTTEKALEAVDEEGAELIAAKAYVRRRRLRDKPRDKALAALSRQGFSFSTAKLALSPC